EQRPPDEELRPEELRLVDGSLLRRADVQQLPRVIPFVHRVRDVEALVTLEPDQPCVERTRDRLRRLRLADARLALEQQRLLELEREVERRRERAVGKVRGARERGLELVDRGKRHARSVPATAV